MKQCLYATIVLLFVMVGNVGAECRCKEPLDLPEMPPENVSFNDMANAEKEISNYYKKAQEYRECLVSCVKDVEKKMSFISGEWNRSVEEYNTRVKNRGSR